MQVWSAETINAVEGHTDIAGTGEVMEGSTVSKNPGVRLFFVGGRISLCGSEAGGNWIRHGVVREQRRGPVADGTCAVSDGWGCSAGTRALGGGSQYASMRRRPVAA